jgi:hypothetical protein
MRSRAMLRVVVLVIMIVTVGCGTAKFGVPVRELPDSSLERELDRAISTKNRSRALGRYVSGPFGDGYENTINENSVAYKVGEVAGVAHGIALGGLTTAKAAGWQTRVAIREAHHTFGRLGRLVHIQVNWWRIGVKGSGNAIRIILPFR